MACYVLPGLLAFRIFGYETAKGMGLLCILMGIFIFVFCELFGLPFLARGGGDMSTVTLVSGLMIAGIIVFLFGNKEFFK